MGMCARYQLVDTPEAFERAASSLSAGRGPFAIDTERASAYRYDNRAFLVQIHRRGAGTYLFAPEGYRAELTRALAPVLNGAEWIVHAAPEDLPSLADLGLHPGRLFDTALAGRIAGYNKPNLGAMVKEFCGVELEKSHGRENWSAVPLPEDWLDYAADDVIYLGDLADAQAELLELQGKTDAAEQEFSHIVDEFAHWSPQMPTWTMLKGTSSLHHARSRAVARAVWTARDEEASRRDVSPTTILPNKVIIAIAKEQPSRACELARIDGFPRRRRGATRKWFTVVEKAYASDPATWPQKQRSTGGAPGKSAWQRHHSESWEALQTMRAAVAETATDLNISPEILLTPAILREAVWALTEGDVVNQTHSVASLLADLGARPWQIEHTAALFTMNLGFSARIDEAEG